VILSIDDDADRDSWCTPIAWARRLGRVWLDPCSNERAHIISDVAWRFDRGQNALKLARYLPPRRMQLGPIFINPPYGRGMVAQFVEAFCRSRFIFLVRSDVSTEWWASLWPYVELEARPTERLDFEPPPGVESSSNPYPHSFLYSRAEDCTAEMMRACYVTTPRRIHAH
jgi:hypothetical protein